MKIHNSPTGRIVKSVEGHDSFVPDPLPPKIIWDDALVFALSTANHVLGRLSKEGSKLPNPYILIRPFIIREAVLSSKIEGTQATIGEVLADNAGVSFKADPDDLKEIHNYVSTLEYTFNAFNELPLSLRLIKKMHEKLMVGVRENSAAPGAFRKSQNWIGSFGCTIETAKYVPPTPNIMMECLGDLEIFLHNRQLPALIHIALCHYQFEAIHPFLDGNGRVGRLLISLLLMEQNMLTAPLLYLSAFFEATRAEYYQLLYSVSSHGNWKEWLVYFLNGVTTQSQDALSRSGRINALLQSWQEMVSKSSLKLALRIVPLCAVNPFLTARNVEKHCGVAFTTAQRALKKLESLGIIKQVEGKVRNRVYCAIEILKILEEPFSL